MKRILWLVALILTVTLMMCIVSCGDGKESATSTTESSKESNENNKNDNDNNEEKEM